MGFFTLEVARLVGPRGRVVAVELQPRMLEGLRRRAGKAGLLDRIDLRLAPGASLGAADLRGRVDFILAFAMVHELSDPASFFSEAVTALVPGGRMLLAEPKGHVSERAFAATLDTASAAGLRAEPGPRVWRSRTALLRRG
jgi:SAM-dependent methyltransferase